VLPGQHGTIRASSTPQETQYNTSMNNDINWRDINEDKSVFLPENKRRQILVETDVTMDVSVAMYVDRNYMLTTREEQVIRYAFID
jgi:hypothetical protein